MPDIPVISANTPTRRPVPSGTVVRRVGPDQAAAVAVVAAATFLDAYAGQLPGAALVEHCSSRHSEAVWRDQLAASHSACWLAEAPGGAPVGYVFTRAPDIPGQRPGDVELRRLYLLSSWRRAGLGAALLDAAATEATDQGACRMILGVWAANAAAVAFYRRQGFRQIDTRQFAVGDLICEDLVLARTLTSQP